MTQAEPKMIATKTRPSWQKALEFASVVGSVVTEGGFASEATVARRLASCRSCPKIDRSPDGQEYCGECDCGRWPLSRLDRKLAFPGLECPLGREGFANEGQVTGETPIERRKCEGCSKPEPDASLLPVGSKVIITATLDGEIDKRPWTVEAARGGEPPTVYDLKRRRAFLSWDGLKNHWRPERAVVSRGALARAGLFAKNR